jgi:hypothetical protein
MMGNLLATIIGVIGGIPIGLGISNWSQKKVKETESKEKLAEEKKHKIKILELIQKELGYNLDILQKNKTAKDNGMERVVYATGFKNDLWMSFTEGGEIEWIKDVELLHFISEAYYRIRGLIYFEDLYFQNRFFPTPHQYFREKANIEIPNILGSLDEDTMSSIEIALTEIKEALESLKTVRF